MSKRLNYAALSNEQMKIQSSMSALGRKSLGNKLIDLVEIRVSQINGCAFCLDMHVKEAKIHGENELRVYHISVWRESPLFSAKERAALEWAEAVTKLGEHGVSDEIYQQALAQFSEKELSDLTFAIASINSWNRLAISFRIVPGSLDKFYGLEKSGLAA